MEINAIIQDNNNGRIWEISQLMENISLETAISGSPGKLSFDFRNDGNVSFYEGSRISLVIDGYTLFFGYVFTKKRNKDGLLSVTAYDQLRYLKNKSYYAFVGRTCSDIFTKVCQDFQLRYVVANESGFVLPDAVHSGVGLYSVLEKAMDATLAYTGQRFFVFDNYGTLTLANAAYYNSNLVIGDASLLLDYDYKSSIDGDTYNQVLIVAESKDGKAPVKYLTKDPNNSKRWGILQYYESTGENAARAQIEAKADMVLKAYNKVQRTLKLKCLGDFRIRAGFGVYLALGAIGDINVSQSAIVSRCTHRISNCHHLMDIEVELQTEGL